MSTYHTITSHKNDLNIWFIVWYTSKGEQWGWKQYFLRWTLDLYIEDLCWCLPDQLRNIAKLFYSHFCSWKHIFQRLFLAYYVEKLYGDSFLPLVLLQWMEIRLLLDNLDCSQHYCHISWSGVSLNPDNPWFEINSSRNNNLAGLLPDAATLGAMNYDFHIFGESVPIQLLQFIVWK